MTNDTDEQRADLNRQLGRLALKRMEARRELDALRRRDADTPAAAREVDALLVLLQRIDQAEARCLAARGKLPPATRARPGELDMVRRVHAGYEEMADTVRQRLESLRADREFATYAPDVEKLDRLIAKHLSLSLQIDQDDAATVAEIDRLEALEARARGL